MKRVASRRGLLFHTPSRFSQLRLFLAAGMLAAGASVASSQPCTNPPPAPAFEHDPSLALKYPKPSDWYAVQYRSENGDWIDATVYISYYGGTVASPRLDLPTFVPYTSNTSLSFVSIPVRGHGDVQIRVTNLASGPFLKTDLVSIRPTAKGIDANLRDGTVQITRSLREDFAGEQFVLWWTRGGTGAAVSGLAIFLDPSYARPTGAKVKVIASANDLAGNLSGFDTLDFEGNVVMNGTGEFVFPVLPNIRNIFLGPGAWVQGKLRFLQDGNGNIRRLYGPGVLDVSRFHYSMRDCGGDEMQSAVSIARPPDNSNGIPDQFILDGIVITDTNRYATDLLNNSTVNNVKTIGWNSNNDGLEFGTLTRATNVFVRSGDDSLKMWGSYTSVSNATVWQNYNGGVVNLGWFHSPGEASLIDGVYVVKTDWILPSDPGVTADLGHSIEHLNNGVIVSELVPGTRFGLLQPSLYRNIFVEDAPQSLFGLKIAPPRSKDPGADNLDLTQNSILNLNIENLFTPQSAIPNLIGFQTLPAGFSISGPPLTADFTMTGTVNVGLYNVDVTPPNQRPVELNSGNAVSTGLILSHGNTVNLTFGDRLPAPSGTQWHSAWTAPQGEVFVRGNQSKGNLTGNLAPGDSVRMIVRPTLSGTAVRIKLENTLGVFPVEFHSTYFGKVQTGAALVPGTNRQLTFNGSQSVTLNPGEGAYSDPLPFPVAAFALYAVSLNVETVTDASGHLLGLVTNYKASGWHASDDSAAFAAIPNGLDTTDAVEQTKGPSFPVWWVSAVDVASANAGGTIVALGDSLTDGRCSTRTNNGAASGVVQPDLYNRWTDLLALRLANTEGPPRAVVNEGIAGNEIAAGVQPALVRIVGDVLEREGATHVIFFEGTNDLAAGTTAAQLIAYDLRVIDDAHARGMKIIGATIIPRGLEGQWTAAMEHERLALNDWIRHGDAFDGVIDFDSVLRGSINPVNGAVSLPQQWSCYDNVHVNAAGYAAMASAIDSKLFRHGENQ